MTLVSGSSNGRGKKRQPLPPLFVYADFEAMQTPQRMFVANLLCYVRADEDECQFLSGETCTLQFLEALDAMTEVADDDREQPIIIVFHNLKGFDGMFVLHELYQQKREVTHQLTVGAKVLSFQSGPLTFIDSLCFLLMPLSAFSATFGLIELKKGFFPHLFNTPDNQQYRGAWPALEFYDPEGMMSKKKKELETWHAQQVARGLPFDFQKEFKEYCESDVLLLKAGCQAFQRQFEDQASFNPMARCMTIASACHLYWRMHHLPPDLIAVEPLRGWRGA